MRKLILIPTLLILLSPAVLADFGDMMGGCGMWSGTPGIFGMGFGIIGLAVGAFIFSVIFWLTYNWLAKKKK